jgi:hypothetical protein
MREKKQQRASLQQETRWVQAHGLLVSFFGSSTRIAPDDGESVRRRLFDPGLGRDARKFSCERSRY